VRSVGALLRKDLKSPVKLEAVREAWDQVRDMSEAAPLPSIQVRKSVPHLTQNGFPVKIRLIALCSAARYRQYDEHARKPAIH